MLIQTFWKSFADLTTQELYAILALRQDVFLVEQQSFYNDIDGIDHRAQHLLAYHPKFSDKLIGYLRIVEDNHPINIQRVVVQKAVRGQGVGQQLITMALSKIKGEYPHAVIRLSAQLTSQKFYSGLGFSTISGPYDDAGVLHVDMERITDSVNNQ